MMNPRAQTANRVTRPKASGDSRRRASEGSEGGHRPPECYGRSGPSDQLGRPALFPGALTAVLSGVMPDPGRRTAGIVGGNAADVPSPQPRHAAAPGRVRIVALTKPRIIELLLVTTVPTMVVAARGVPSAG